MLRFYTLRFTQHVTLFSNVTLSIIWKFFFKFSWQLLLLCLRPPNLFRSVSFQISDIFPSGTVFLHSKSWPGRWILSKFACHLYNTTVQFQNIVCHFWAVVTAIPHPYARNDKLCFEIERQECPWPRIICITVFSNNMIFMFHCFFIRLMVQVIV